MDARLDILRTRLKNSWFPTDLKLFQRNDAPDIDGLIELMFSEAIQSFNLDYPSVVGKVYEEFISSVDGEGVAPKLYLADMDPDILRILGIYDTSPSVGRDITGRGLHDYTQLNTPYLAEQTAIELYMTLAVDEWSGRMDTPMIMTDDVGDFINPNLNNFIVFFLKSRTLTADNIPSSLYKAVEPYLVKELASYVMNALGKYPLSLKMQQLDASSDSIDPSRMKSISIDGKLELELNPIDSAADQMSGIFDSGAMEDYMDNLGDIQAEAKKLFEALKYIELGGITVT